MRITVLTGGTSAERDVAIASAVQIITALRSSDPALILGSNGTCMALPASGFGI